MSAFFQSKSDRDVKLDTVAAPAAKPAERLSPDQVSTLGRGMQITGNIVCAGTVQIYGRVTGDIQVTGLAVCEGARVDGKIVAQDTVIQGTFHGTIHSNTVKLAKTAVVDGEIFSKSLMIEQDAQFEGVSRKLDKTIDPPGTQSAKPAPVVAAPSTVPLNGMANGGAAPIANGFPPRAVN